MTISALLFDLDGTLVDTLADIAAAMNRVMVRCGFRPHSVESYRMRIGLGVDHLAQMAIADANPQAVEDGTLVATAAAMMRQEYARAVVVQSRPYPGIVDLLSALHRREIPIAVLSNKRQELTAMVIEALFEPSPFRLVRGAQQHVPNKPHPAAALWIADQLEIAPEYWLYVGDSATDVKTALNAGMNYVGVLWGFRPTA